MNAGNEKTVFISYARADVETVQGFVQRLGAFSHFAFVDDQLEAGQDWWEVILENIRACRVFLCAVSPSSVRSRACKAELNYAHALGKKIVPIMVRKVRVEDAPDVLQQIHIEDFINPQFDDFAQLDTVLDEANELPHTPLPDPLPDPPDAPMADLSSARELVSQDDLSPADQLKLVAELGAVVLFDDDRPAAVGVLEQLSRHPRKTEAVGRAVTELLARYRFAPSDTNSMNLMKSVVRALVNEQCMPITGSGMTDWLVGSRKDLAQEWASEYSYPLNLSQRDDLPQVAQYISVTETNEIMREHLARFYRQQLKEKFPEIIDGPVEGPRAFDLDAGVVDVWRSAADRMPAEPHKVLATLPCKIYINAEPTALLTEALSAEKVRWPDGEVKHRKPRHDFCRWNREASDAAPESPFQADPSYIPSIEEPLVFHVFGTLQYPESLVITEDDFFDFLGAVAETPELIPTQLIAAVAESNLLFLGFGLQDWDVRVLLRALINREIAEDLGKRFKHVAADDDAAVAEVVARVDDAKEYLGKYFGEFAQPKISVFWASVQAFCEGLESAWTEQASEGRS